MAKRRHKCTRCGDWFRHKNTCKMPINPRVVYPQHPNPVLAQVHEVPSSSVATNTSSVVSSSTWRRCRGKGKGTSRGGRVRAGRVLEGFGVYIPSKESLFDMPMDTFPTQTSARRAVPLRGKHTAPIWKP